MEQNNKITGKINYRRLVPGIIYILLIGVVIYGSANHVYDGFGAVVPWIISLVFAAMGVVRIAEGITGRSVNDQIELKFGGKDEPEAAEDESRPE